MVDDRLEECAACAGEGCGEHCEICVRCAGVGLCAPENNNDDGLDCFGPDDGPWLEPEGWEP